MKTNKILKLITVCAACLWLQTGCEKSTGPDSNSGPGTIFILGSDFASGLLEWMSEEDNTISSSNLEVNSDASLRSYGKFLYVLERFGSDNVLKFDPSKSGTAAVLYQTKMGTNWNPVDMEFVSETKAYIANQNEPKITVFNPTANSVIKQIDISQYTFNPDSNISPHASDLELVGSDLYVLLQRRDGYMPGAPSLILKINTSTDEVTDTIALKHKNGYGMVHVNGSLYVSNPGSAFFKGDGAIEKINLSTKEVTTIIDEDALGGNSNQILHKEGNRFYVTNYIGWKNVKVVEIDVESKSIVSTLPDIKDAFGGIAFDKESKVLYVGERDSVEAGVKVFKNNLKTAGPIKTSKSLPPSSIAIVR